MRIILNLTPKEKYEINFNYHFKAMGFVYQLLMNTKFEKLHDKKMYKNFCFSNIFQSSHKQDKNWKFIISSPDEKFINQVEFSLKKVIENQIPVQLGKFFDLDSFEVLNSLNSTKLISSTPIIVRMNKERFETITKQTTTFDEVFWRKEHPISLFVEHIEENMRQKYKDFTKKEINSRILEKFEIQKQVATKVTINQKPVTFIGGLWKLELSENLTNEQKVFCAETGFGERNSMGFGFVNRR